jgi:hypothetical protein
MIGMYWMSTDWGKWEGTRQSYILVFLINIWEMNPSTFFKSDPFKSPQSDWRDLWRSCIMCINTTYGAGACQSGDMAPRRCESHRVIWHNWVSSPTPTWLAAQPHFTTCPPVAPEHTTWLSHTRPVGMTGPNLNRRVVSSSSLHSLSLFSLWSLSWPPPPPSRTNAHGVISS